MKLFAIECMPRNYQMKKSIRLFILFVFGLPIIANGQNHLDKGKTSNCHLKDLLCDDSLFRIRYLWSIRDMCKDQRLLETYTKQQIENRYSSTEMTFSTYKLFNDSAVDIGISDSALVVSMSMFDNSFVINFTKRVDVDFIGYQIYSNSVSLYFYMNVGSCKLYFKHWYDMEFKQHTVTEFDHGPSN